MLGAELARALRQRWPDVRLAGIGGPRMAAAGVECWHDIAELSVMGLAEVLRHLPRLLRLRRELVNELREAHPDLVVGIDAPDFNLGLEKRLKTAGIVTAHYVSPSVWAWREKRVQKIGHCADQVLCLFPNEPAIYARHGVAARFVGHPLARRFPRVPDRRAARRALGITESGPVLALLPGSRASEIERLADIFIDAGQRLAAWLPDLTVLVPAANERCFKALQARLASTPSPAAQSPVTPTFKLLDGQADTALTAADVALLASGTVALEAMLAKCPMVVAYRIAPLSYALIRALKLMKTSLYSLPNMLAGHALVPELMQDDCQPGALAAAVHQLFTDEARRRATTDAFSRLHRELLGDDDATPAERATAAIAALLSPEVTRA